MTNSFANLAPVLSKAIDKRIASLEEEAEKVMQEIVADVESGEIIPCINALGQWFIYIEEYLPKKDTSDREDLVFVLRQNSAGLEVIQVNDGVIVKPTDVVVPSEHEEPENLYYYCTGCGIFGKRHSIIVGKHSEFGKTTGPAGDCDNQNIKAVNLDDECVAEINANREIDFLELVGRQRRVHKE